MDFGCFARVGSPSYRQQFIELYQTAYLQALSVKKRCQMGSIELALKVDFA